VTKVVELRTKPTGMVQMRERFEAWACKEMSPSEREAIFVRTKGGEYLRYATKTAWLGWQAGIQDLIQQYLDEQPPVGTAALALVARSVLPFPMASVENRAAEAAQVREETPREGAALQEE
jgi:hypothetical protein